MTDSNYTAIAVVVDRSGSMASIQLEAENGLNEFIAEQKKQDGKATLRLDQFDNVFETVFPTQDIQNVPRYHLQPRGMTALNDGIGKTVTEFGAELAALPEDERPGNVVVVVVTDGGENSSREFTTERVKELVKEQEDKYGWTFIFLAANMDAIAVGGGYGVAAGNSLTYDVNNIGATYALASSKVSGLRSTGNFDTFTDAERSSVV